MNYYIKETLKKPIPNNLDKEIIKCFGKEKLNQLKVAEELQLELNKICKKYLFIKPIPILFDHTIKSTALYHIELDAIILHPKNINNKNRLLVSLFHELEHAFQIHYVNNFNTKKSIRWSKELKNYTINNEHYYNQEIEIDAIAFSQIIMLEEYNVIVENPDKILQKKIDKYKFNLSKNN